MTDRQTVTRNVAWMGSSRLVDVTVPPMPEGWAVAPDHAETAPRNRIIRRAPMRQPQTRAEIAIAAIREMHREATA